MQKHQTTIKTQIDLPLEPQASFDVLVEELSRALDDLGFQFKPGENGELVQKEFRVGKVIAWEPGRRFLFDWHPANWQPDESLQVELRLEPVAGGARLTFEQRGWGNLIESPDELTGWVSGQVLAPLLQAVSPEAFGDWLTDRVARRPQGAGARFTYRDPLYHYPNFRAILSELALEADDVLLEVGCGGGAFLREALRSGCRAAAVDHSPEMVHLAREENQQAVAEGRLDVRHASADRLPFADETFTCAVMTGVLGFLADPVAAFREIYRTLQRGGRLVVLGSDPTWKGTPAAPEPMASRLHFYTDPQLEQLARQAGFEKASVVRRDLEQNAREVGIPPEHISLFAGPGAPFLIARKS